MYKSFHPEEIMDDSPIEEVRLTVPTTDDPTLPCLTFRTWCLGILSCVLLAFVNQFFGYRQNQLSVSSLCAQIVTLPLGKLMAATLPTKVIRVPMTNWSFSLNPGPFNLKEHVLITIFANSGSGGVYAINIITILVGTIIASATYFGTGWWLLSSVKNICQPDLLPEGSPWTCPGDSVFYDASIIWGVVGPLRMFGPLGHYMKINWFFLIGFLAPVPVWLLHKKYPENKWIPLINMPVIIGATGIMPPARSVNFLTWGIIGITFNFFVYRRYKKWWARHNYVLSAGLDSGSAFMAIVAFFALNNYDIFGVTWWGNDSGDHCPLASCPTAPGVSISGCPAI